MAKKTRDLDKEVRKHLKRSSGRLKTFAEAFRTFAMRGNVMDMTVGIIVGGALTKVVTSIVNDILMPVFSLVTGKLGHTDWVITLGAEEGAPQMMLGSFLSGIVDFLILAFCVFLIVRLINRFSDALKTPPKPEPPAHKCPYCLQQVDEKATRCPFCTSHIGNTEQV